MGIIFNKVSYDFECCQLFCLLNFVPFKIKIVFIFDCNFCSLLNSQTFSTLILSLFAIFLGFVATLKVLRELRSLFIPFWYLIFNFLRVIHYPLFKLTLQKGCFTISAIFHRSEFGQCIHFNNSVSKEVVLFVLNKLHTFIFSNSFYFNNGSQTPTFLPLFLAKRISSLFFIHLDVFGLFK